MPDLWVLLLAFGAAGRLTRLINHDVIGAPLRLLVMRVFGAGSTADEFIRCPWCVSFWVSLAAAWAAFTPAIASSKAFLIVAAALTMSWLVSLVAKNLDPQN